MQDGVTENLPANKILHAAELIGESRFREAKQYIWDARKEEKEKKEAAAEEKQKEKQMRGEKAAAEEAGIDLLGYSIKPDELNQEILEDRPSKGSKVSGMWLCRSVNEAVELMTEFVGSAGSDAWISIIYIGKLSKYVQAEAVAHGLKPQQRDIKMEKQSEDGQTVTVVRTAYVWNAQGDGELKYKVTIPKSSWKTDDYRHSTIQIAEAHDKLVFDKALAAHQRLSEGQDKLKQMKGKGKGGGKADNKGGGKGKTKEGGTKEREEWRKKVEEAKEELAEIIIASLDKKDGDVEEDRKITINSTTCFQGEREDQRQMVIEILTTNTTAKRLRETSGQKSIFQRTPGHDVTQKTKDKENEKWEKLEEETTRKEAWDKLQAKADQTAGLQLAHDGRTMLMRIPEQAIIKVGEKVPIKKKYVLEKIPASMPMMALQAELEATINWKVENTQLMLGGKWTKTVTAWAEEEPAATNLEIGHRLVSIRPFVASSEKGKGKGEAFASLTSKEAAEILWKEERTASRPGYEFAHRILGAGKKEGGNQDEAMQQTEGAAKEKSKRKPMEEAMEEAMKTRLEQVERKNNEEIMEVRREKERVAGESDVQMKQILANLEQQKAVAETQQASMMKMNQQMQEQQKMNEDMQRRMGELQQHAQDREKELLTTISEKTEKEAELAKKCEELDRQLKQKRQLGKKDSNEEPARKS